MKLILIIFLITLVSNLSLAQPKTFSNPILPSGADPWCIKVGGYYYYTNSMSDSLVVWKTRNIVELSKATQKTIWIPPTGTSYSHELWAPELHFIDHKWYMYFAADDGKNDHHRIYVLENSSEDPLKGTWQLKGKVADQSNKWAIDASVFRSKGQLYMIWAGWEGNRNGEQDIYIAQLKNPWTIGSKRVKISYPAYAWEKYGELHDSSNPAHVNVNEGPEILKHNGKLFLIYSASGCWTDYYALGMLHASINADLLDPHSWKKSAQPVFKQSPENGVFAPGHNCFFKSPDGKQDWILYHANSRAGLGCGKSRSPRAQKFTWDKQGYPDFGVPLKEGIQIPVPSGTQ